MREYRKIDVKVGVGKLKTKNIYCHFFKCLPNFRAHVLQSNLNKVSIFNFVKFQLQRMNSKIEQALKK